MYCFENIIRRVVVIKISTYSVEFDLSDMGSAELLTFTDDLGNVQYAQETGILTFGG